MINTIASYTFTQQYSGYTGSIRSVCPVTGPALKQVRCTFIGVGSLIASNLSVGVWAGTLTDTKATPVELLVGGSSGANFSGIPVVTDWVNLTGFTASDSLVCICELTSGTNAYDAITGSAAYICSSPSYNQAVTPGGFRTVGAYVYCFSKI
jgi:hypothetical protein